MGSCGCGVCAPRSLSRPVRNKIRLRARLRTPSKVVEQASVSSKAAAIGKRDNRTL